MRFFDIQNNEKGEVAVRNLPTGFNGSDLPGDDLHRYVEDLGDLQDGVDVATGARGHVVGRAGLGPAIDELPRAAGEASAHIGVADGQDLAGLVDTLGHDMKLYYFILF